MNRKLELIIASLAVASVRIVIILDVFPLSEGQSNLIFTFDSLSRDTSSRPKIGCDFYVYRIRVCIKLLSSIK
jgi:hypothetical protein